MGIYIDRGKTKQHVEGHENPEEAAVLGLPRQEYENGGNADMAAGEGSGRPFAGTVGINHHLIEWCRRVARCVHGLAHGLKIVMQVGEYTCCYFVQPYSRKVVLRTSHRQEDKNDIIYKERGEDNEGSLHKLFIAEQKEEKRYNGYEREVCCIAHIHELAENDIWTFLCEEQRRLAAKELLFEARHEVVEVGEHPVELVGIRVPPGE